MSRTHCTRGLMAMRVRDWILILSLALLPQTRAATSLLISPTRGQPGVSVPVPLTLLGETNVVAFQADVLFDPAKISPGNAVAGAATAHHLVASSDPAPGIKRVLCYSLASEAITDGILARLNFAIAPGLTDNAVRLSLSNVVLVTASAGVVSAVHGNGLIVIHPVSLRPGGHVEFILSALAGQTNVVQASTNLEQWIDLGEVSPVGSFLEFTDTNANLFPHRFYRSIPRP